MSFIIVIFLLLDMEMYGKKKGKKKKKPFSLDEMSDALPEAKDNGVAAGEDREPPTIQAAEVDDFDLDMDFTRTKKKKTKKKKVLNDLLAKDEGTAEADDKEFGKCFLLFVGVDASTCWAAAARADYLLDLIVGLSLVCGSQMCLS